MNYPVILAALAGLWLLTKGKAAATIAPGAPKMGSRSVPPPPATVTSVPPPPPATVTSTFAATEVQRAILSTPQVAEVQYTSYGATTPAHWVPKEEDSDSVIKQPASPAVSKDVFKTPFAFVQESAPAPAAPTPNASPVPTATPRFATVPISLAMEHSHDYSTGAPISQSEGLVQSNPDSGSPPPTFPLSVPVGTPETPQPTAKRSSSGSGVSYDYAHMHSVSSPIINYTQEYIMVPNGMGGTTQVRNPLYSIRPGVH